MDLLLIATPDGAEPGLSLLAEQAYRRGCTVVAVAPARSPLNDAVSASRGLFIPMATAPYDHDEPLAGAAPGVLWALLTPLLALLDRTGLLEAPPEAIDKVADRLDQIAERCGPAIVTYSNPAKTLASELAETLPVVWTEGTSAGPAGRRFAAALAELAGTPAGRRRPARGARRAQRTARRPARRRRRPRRLLPRPRRRTARPPRARGPPARPPQRRSHGRSQRP
ncbi:putative regulator of the mannose operon, ManO [Streptomyces lividans 1326]|uniref:Putative regulator of the mannose operon, ManO n=1 Tax=Streptomyces lividans 1326 TaxID=1200984 RepID=A0A7U9HCT9_STRLI|nr:putative regulator of the mannose operon, ManO [Streptomyces lividans 1326]